MLGYRRQEVDAALAAVESALAERGAALERERTRVGELARVADRLAELAAQRGRELNELRVELERARAQGVERLGAIARLATQLEEIRGQARGQATRIRMQALREAAAVGERAAEVSASPNGAGERLLGALAAAVERVGEDPEAVGARANGAPRGEVFEGRVEVEVGPLDDFSKLVGFEDAATAIGATSEISVKRFTQGRATLEMRLSEPVALLRELEERAPFEFRVRDQRADRLVLDIDDE